MEFAKDCKEEVRGALWREHFPGGGACRPAVGRAALGGRRIRSCVRGQAPRALTALFLASCLLAAISPLSAKGEEPRSDLENPDKGRPEGGVTWYFAEGCTRAGFEEWLVLFNPGANEVLAEVEYVVERGINRTRYYSLPPRSRINVYVNQEVGSGHDLAVIARSDRYFIAERSLYFNYRGVWSGGYSVSGANAPSGEWYFAEGGAGRERDCWLSLLNPHEEDCEARIFLVRENSDNLAVPLLLPASRRVTVNVNELAGSWDGFFIMVMADRPVVAERQQFFSYRSTLNRGLSCAGGFSSFGAVSPSEELFFASAGAFPDRDCWLVLANPGVADAAVTVEQRYAQNEVRRSVLWIAGLSRCAFSLRELGGGDGEFSLALRSHRPVLGEVVTYFDLGAGINGGTCLAGRSSGGSRWCLADLNSGEDYRSWLELASFSEAPVRVAVYIYVEGTAQSRAITIDPFCRAYLSSEELAPQGGAFSCEILADGEVQVQKSAFFRYHGLWGGGSTAPAHLFP